MTLLLQPARVHASAGPSPWPALHHLMEPPHPQPLPQRARIRSSPPIPEVHRLSLSAPFTRTRTRAQTSSAFQRMPRTLKLRCLPPLRADCAPAAILAPSILDAQTCAHLIAGPPARCGVASGHRCHPLRPLSLYAPTLLRQHL